MLKSVLSKRRFAKTAFELGNTFPTSSLEDKTSKFYSLEPLKGLEQALAAAEESVVVKLPGPSSYQRRKCFSLEMIDLKFIFISGRFDAGNATKVTSKTYFFLLSFILL